MPPIVELAELLIHDTPTDEKRNGVVEGRAEQRALQDARPRREAADLPPFGRVNAGGGHGRVGKWRAASNTLLSTGAKS